MDPSSRGHSCTRAFSGTPRALEPDASPPDTHPMQHCDYLVVGGGIAGASLAYHLCRYGRVIVLEGEGQPGYHATGRSAAIYTQCYGPRIMRAMTRLSGPFLREPPAGFASTPLLTPLGVLFVARADQRAAFTRRLGELREIAPHVREVDTTEALRRCPVLRLDQVERAVLDPQAMNMDVNALHLGYLRTARAAGVMLATNARVTALARTAGAWHARTTAGAFTAPVLVDAAGAWADAVAMLAGVTPAGLVARRRTAVLFDPPAGSDPHAWPAVWDIEDGWYFKPESHQVLATPGDETPVPPQDVQPEELDIALAMDRVQRATSMRPRRVNRAWAGLRTFAHDRNPVVGFDPDAPGFFWLAGQGGYGIKTSWALGLTATCLITRGALPREVTDYGISADEIAPARLRAAA